MNDLSDRPNVVGMRDGEHGAEKLLGVTHR